MESNITRLARKGESVPDRSSVGAPKPSGETVQQLAVEAGKCLGVEAGTSISVTELRKQADANGYSPEEIDRLLADAGVRGAGTVTVPKQGDLLGSLWKPAGVPSPSPQTDTPDAIERFREWLQHKADNDATGHSYSRRTADRRYARAKDVDRYFVDTYDVFSTVLITYDWPRTGDESLLEQTDRAYPRSVVGKRRRVLKSLDVYGEYAGVSVLAPKRAPAREHSGREHRVPHPNARTHGHDFLWVPNIASKADFKGLASVTDADVNISVETHRSSDVTTPKRVADRGNNMDAQRGATTALPHELGDNLPLLRTNLDARGLPEYAEYWCAQMRLGADDSLKTKGVHRFRTHGQFRECADAKRWKRRIREGESVASVLSKHLEENRTALQRK